jgi:hypothetical protein
MCCCIDNPPDLSGAVTAIATVVLAAGTILLAALAYHQLHDIRKVIRLYAFSAFLNQEKELLNKQKVIHKTTIALNRALVQPDPSFEVMEALINTLDVKVDDYLNALDRLGYSILNGNFPEDELRRTYHRVINEVFETYRSEIDNKPYRNIQLLHVRWSVRN